MLEKTSFINKNIDKVIKLYKKFDLIASKIIVLYIEKDTRNFDDWLQAELLQPTLLIEHYKGYFIGWAIEGKITTKKQKEFYKHLALRLKKTLLKKTDLHIVKVSSVWALQYALENGYKETNKRLYELKDLAKTCISLTAKEEKNNKLNDLKLDEEFAIFAGTYTKTEDALFDFIRFKAYDYKKNNIINNIETTLEDLENYCRSVAEIGYDIVGGKGISTAYAKARNIAEWVLENYGNGKRKRKTKNDKEYEMTRRENIVRINKLRAEDRKLRVQQAIESLKFIGERISVRKVAEYANISTKTAQKYLKQLKEEDEKIALLFQKKKS